MSHPPTQMLIRTLLQAPTTRTPLLTQLHLHYHLITLGTVDNCNGGLTQVIFRRQPHRILSLWMMRLPTLSQGNHHGQGIHRNHLPTNLRQTSHECRPKPSCGFLHLTKTWNCMVPILLPTAKPALTRLHNLEMIQILIRLSLLLPIRLIIWRIS